MRWTQDPDCYPNLPLGRLILSEIRASRGPHQEFQLQSIVFVEEVDEAGQFD